MSKVSKEDIERRQEERRPCRHREEDQRDRHNQKNRAGPADGRCQRDA